MNEFAPMLIAAAMLTTAVAFFKNLTARDYTSAATLLFIVTAGIGIAFLLATSSFAGEVKVGSHTLADLDASGVIIFGYAIASSSRLLFEFKKAVDSSDSAKETQLIPSTPPN